MTLTLRLKEVTAVLGTSKEMAAATVESKVDTGTGQQESRIITNKLVLPRKK